jgi:hypothetical protein
LRLYVNYFQPSMKLLSNLRIEGHTTRRYDNAQTRYQRALNSSAIGEELKNGLRDGYQKLDPVVLLKELERLQDQFWEYAHRKPSHEITRVVPSEILQRAEPQRVLVAGPVCKPGPSAVQKLPRPYRRTRKPSVPRTWRTRKDPLAEVWGQVQLLLDIDPSRSVKDLFLELQQRYAGKFSSGQLRTLQRRVKQRRREQLYSRQSIQGSWPNLVPELHV